MNSGRFTGDPTAVSARMRLIRSRDTKPERLMFNILDRSGWEYVWHPVVLTIHADALVLSTIVIFVDSPFWHLRDLATLERLDPHWRQRLLTNRRRDRRQDLLLRREGFSVLRIWTDQIREESIKSRVLQIARARRKRSGEPPLMSGATLS